MSSVPLRPNGYFRRSATLEDMSDLLVQDRTAADMVSRRERSSCTLMPVNTQNDLAS